MMVHADLAGNAYVARTPTGLRVLRPDWVDIIIGSTTDPTVDSTDVDSDVIGYVYWPGGRSSGREPETFLRSEVAHFAPIPDPLARVRGMSWLTPIVREVAADSAARDHKLRFFENAATPNMVVRLDKDAAASQTPKAFEEWVDLFKKKEPRGSQVYKTMYLAGGADVTVVGKDLQQLEFKVTQGAGETRIAAAAGVPPVIVGLSEGLQAATYSNYGQARRRYADLTMRPLWRNAAGSLSVIVRPPAGAELWYDDRDIPFLAEDRKDASEVAAQEAQTIRTLVDAGYDPVSVVAAVKSADWSMLKHSGLYSVQLQAPGAVA
jgi:phage portal protein BeeE